MIIGIGTDIIDCKRIKNSIDKYNSKFLKRIFDDVEIKYCETFKHKNYLHYAVRFAAKEAFSKAIGTGITKGFKFNEVCVRNNEQGSPYFELFGLMKERYSHYKIFLSLSHSDDYATAFVVISE